MMTLMKCLYNHILEQVFTFLVPNLDVGETTDVDPYLDNDPTQRRKDRKIY